MRGKNPAWLILLCDDGQVKAGCLSGTLIRNQKPAEPVIAFVSKCVNRDFIPQLLVVFDQVILAPEVSPWGNLEERNMLLLQTLKLNSFSILVVVEAGTWVGQSFDQTLETGTVRNQKGDWMLVSVAPNSNTYSEAVSSLKSGKSFDDTQFIADFIAFACDGGGADEVGYSWSTLKYYDGLKMPLVSLSPEIVSTLLKPGRNMDLTTTGFWQKAVLAALVPFIALDETMEDRDEEQHKKSWIAIVGMSCRFPGANSVEEYWQVLSSGLSTASAPPPNRLGKCELTEEMRANFLKCPIDEFDAPFFEIPPSTAASLCPQARLLLEVSWEAFEDARINPQKLKATPVGVFYGSWIQEYKDMLNLEQRSDHDFVKKYVGNGFSSTASKLSFFYGFTGPNIATESGCCSSLMAVQLACESLQNGHCPMALAAGANVILQMDQQQKVLWAADGISRSFDSRGNGYGRGEGVGVLVLKRYSDAIRDADRIHGIVIGSGISQEGLATSFATPTVESEARTMRNALLSAKIRPVDVDYVEAHATGTGVGDPIEAEAIVKAYSSASQRKTPLLVGSVKTNIGHAESCSGIASIIKVMLALKHETIPPHINVETINPKVDFSPIPGKISLEKQDWKRSPVRARVAGVSNFGISGTDMHMMIQEPPNDSGASNGSFSKFHLHILTFSAKTSVALDQLAEAYIKMLRNGNETLADITYTANACRAHRHPYKRAIIASTKKELASKLKEPNPPLSSESGRKLEVCFICHDHVDEQDWEQYKALYSQFPAFEISMDACDAVCKDTAGFSPVAFLFDNKNSSSDSWEREAWQFSAFSVTYSLYKLWESWGVKGSIVLGLNFGELIGAAIAGKLELAQCLQLVMKKNTTIETKEKSGPKPDIRYISAKPGTRDLDIEHLKEICCKKIDSSDELLSVLATASSISSCDIVIQLDVRGKFELRTNSTNVLHLPTTEGSGLTCLLTSLATLYTNGYPIDWEGFYAHQVCKKVSLPHYPFQRKPYWFNRGQRAYAENVTYSLLNTNVHPLLGSYIPISLERDSEDASVHIFENLLAVQQHAPYILAHKIGSEVIFPAVAHLELLLAASNFQGEEVGMPLIVENFKIHQPLHLPSISRKLFRTTMERTTTGWSIFVETQTQGENWKRYASGDIQLQTSQLQLQQPTLEELKLRLISKKFAASEFYGRLAELGLNFGTEFKSLKNIYESESNDEILAEVSNPGDAIHHVCHPLLTDAMLQCFIFHKHADLTTLNVPVGIKKFVCHRRLRPAECSGKKFATSFIYFNQKEQTVFLLDSNGNQIATMTEPEIKVTTVGSILAAAGCAPKKSGDDGELDIWQECWKTATKYQSEGSLTPGVDFTQSPRFISLLRNLEQRNVFITREKELSKRLDRLSELFVYKAFYELGWDPKIGETFSVSELAAKVQIAPNYLNAFRYYLTDFENSGVLEISGQRDTTTTTYKIVRLPETKELVENYIDQLSKALENYEPIQSIIACATVLAPVMQGKIKGQQLLFNPGENGVTHADIMYKGHMFYKTAAKAGPKLFFEIAHQLWHNGKELGQGRKLRILEIGGGTAIFTSEAICLLEAEGIEYSYHFTDISSHFFKKAESRFPQLGPRKRPVRARLPARIF